MPGSVGTDWGPERDRLVNETDAGRSQAGREKDTESTSKGGATGVIEARGAEGMKGEAERSVLGKRTTAWASERT